MKKFLKITLPIMFVTILATFPIQISKATVEEARREAQAAKRLLEYYGYDVRSYYTEGTLDDGESTTLSRTFYAGTEYALLVGGCSYTRDIDIYVYDKYWNLIASDNASEQYAIATFDVYQTGTFYIKIKMYDATSDGVHWAMQYGYK